MNMLKKMTILCIACAVLILLFVAAPVEVHAYRSGDYQYTISGEEAWITYYWSYPYSLSIPETLGGYPVTSIEYHAFNGCKLRQVTIPGSVTNIDVYAFTGNPNLSSIYYMGNPQNLPFGFESLSSCADNAGSTGSTNIYVEPSTGESWERISGIWYARNADGTARTGWVMLGEDWYYYDNSGKAASGLQEIGGVTYGFGEGGLMLTGFSYLDGDYYYFDANGAMKTGWVKNDGKWYYYGTDGKRVSGLTEIDGKTYYFDTTSGYMMTGRVGIKSYQQSYYYFDPISGAMRTGWVKDGDNWYYYDQDGKSANGLTEIAGKYYYFEDYIMETGAYYIDSQVYHFGSDGASQDSWTETDNGFTYRFDGQSAAVTAGTNYTNGLLEIPSEMYFTYKTYYDGILQSESRPVTAIGAGAFAENTQITAVWVHDGITAIEAGAFENCSNLKDVYFEGTAQQWAAISKQADSVIFPKAQIHFNAKQTYGRGSCGKYVYWKINCTKTLIIYGTGAMDANSNWENNANVEHIVVEPGVTTIDSVAFYNCTAAKTVTISDTVQTIGYRAFENCISLKHVTVPDSVTDIDGYAFDNCVSLESIKLSKNLIRIAGGAFRECTRLKSITIPEGVLNIEDYAFHVCTDLTNVIIPTSVVNIGEGAFLACDNLTDVYYAGTEDQWNDIYINRSNPKLKNAQKHWNSNTSVQNGWFMEGNIWYYSYNYRKVTGWLKAGSSWYFFDGSGAMKTGWQYIGGTWYYFKTSGVMATGWQLIDGAWYYFNAGGIMLTGWQQIGGTWYYFNAGGVMLTGWQQIGGIWYYFKSGGAMVTGWCKVGSTWYYFNTSGAMKVGWLKLGNIWYYFHSSGAMATGSVKIGNKTYNFNASGACLNP